MNSMDRTPQQMREDALMWSRAKFPAVAVGRYRDAADQIERLEKILRASMHALRSYEYGNAATEVAKEVADAAELVLQKETP
jgi:hypothetical protein